MQAQLTTDIGDFKAGRIGRIVETPLAKVQLIDHNESELVPERESCEEAFDYWFEPVLASNEAATKQGTVIPVTKSEINILGGTMSIDRNELFQITKEVNLYAKGILTDAAKFEANTKRSNQLFEQNPEEFEAFREAIYTAVEQKNQFTADACKVIVEELSLPENITEWSIEQVEAFIAEAKKTEHPKLVVTAILNSEPTAALFEAIENVVLSGE